MAESAKGADPATRPTPVRRGLRFFGAGLVVLTGVLFAKAFAAKSRQISAPPVTVISVDEARAAEHLSRAVTFRTISHEAGGKTETAAFEGLHKALEEMFPNAHRALTKEVVGDHSLLFTWKGKSADAPPILLMAHQDVVPIEPGTEGDWEQPPFSGAIRDGYIWGRGTMDDKNGVIGLLNAVDLLVAEGFSPSRTVYLAFGHDEEIGGTRGAMAIAKLLESRGIKLEYVLDEGMFLTQGILKGVNRPVALIGIAEKGYVSLELSVDTRGGHSSVPPRPTSTGILANAIVRLEQSPMPAHIAGSVKVMFETLAPEMPVAQRVIFSNLWLLSPVVERLLSRSPATDAMIRTTTAPTMLEGSVKENVLPKRPRAVVNFRILPGNTVASVIDHVKRTVGDERILVKPYGNEWSREPSPESSVEGPGYKTIETAVRQVFPDAIVAPALVLGTTDSSHYQQIAQGVYRFGPTRLTDDDRPRFHGTNERASTKNFAEQIQFYAQLIKNAAP